MGSQLTICDHRHLQHFLGQCSDMEHHGSPPGGAKKAGCQREPRDTNRARGPLPPPLSLSPSQHKTLSTSIFLPCAWAGGFEALQPGCLALQQVTHAWLWRLGEERHPKGKEKKFSDCRGG